MKKNLKTFLIIFSIVVFLAILIIVASDKTVKGTVYDYDTREPLEGVKVDIRIGYCESFIDLYCTDYKSFVVYTDSNGDFELKTKKYDSVLIDYSLEGYHPHGGGREVYLVKVIDPLDLPQKYFNDLISPPGGKAYLSNGDFFEISYSYDEDKLDDVNWEEGFSKIKFSYSGEGLIHAGEPSGNFLEEARKAPLGGYSSEENEFEDSRFGGSYFFKTSDGNYGKMQLRLTVGLSYGDPVVRISGDYYISNESNNVETF